ncbi:hypothetical protein UFOVP71_240 [uncultured Caudovirales phage]|uniref:Uncharacterized protein n=1 Tax=uncultured Caudovirales phage TaxID=2100421 RepID=A0A6J5TA38_9CAUD|nr:hypothetical protein UFOVP71_240 [uncultured Caudovirales phage]
MGLDMYLNAKRFLWHDEEKLATDLKDNFPDLPETMRIKEVTIEALYWRKANAIHKWFVDNVQGGVDECQETDVSLAQLEKLLEVIEQVLDDPSKVHDLLPPTAGFFFGSKDVDQWYWDDLKQTHSKLQELFTRDWKNWDFSYRASW